MVLFCQRVNPWVNPLFRSLRDSFFGGSNTVFFQPDLSCQGASLTTVFHAEFFKNAMYMVLHSVFR